MTKYFSKDTPLASLERMMMSVPGFQKRGGGMMVLCRFHYKKEDVDCAYCQSYMRHTCQASVCPYIPERLEAGTVSYQELAEGCLHMAGHQKLWNRLSSLPKGKSLPLVLEPAHRRRLSEWLEAGICPKRFWMQASFQRSSGLRHQPYGRRNRQMESGGLCRHPER